MEVSDLITVDPDILGGTPVFKGTRVPIKTLFEYLESNYSLEEFLECFPSVTREMACRVLERSEAVLLAPAMKILVDECVPWPMRHLFSGHDCTSVQRRGWRGTKNGALLALAVNEFDLFITSDQNIRYQQNLLGSSIAILELSTNDLRRIRAAGRHDSV